MKNTAYDFLFPTHVSLIDQAAWLPISANFLGHEIRILKPVTNQTSYPVPSSIGNQQLDAYSTIIRLELSTDAPPDSLSLCPLAFQCLAWVRALTRQYWVGSVGSGSAVVRVSSLSRDLATEAIEPVNSGSFSTPIIPEHLSEQIWAEVGLGVSSGQFPRNSDLVFCNGMLALRDQNLREAITLLGIAPEIEVSDSVESLLWPSTNSMADLLYKKARPDFKWKLKELLPAIYGRKFSEDEPHWHQELIALYETRGKAVHSAIDTDVASRVPRFVLATDVFLRWMHSIRKSNGQQIGPCPVALRAVLG